MLHRRSRYASLGLYSAVGPLVRSVMCCSVAARTRGEFRLWEISTIEGVRWRPRTRYSAGEHLGSRSPPSGRNGHSQRNDGMLPPLPASTRGRTQRPHQ